MWAFTHQWVLVNISFIGEFQPLDNKKNEKNLVWLIQKTFVGKLSHLTMSLREARYQKCHKILTFSSSCSQIALIPLVDWCPGYIKKRNKYGTHNSPFSQNNNWKCRRKTLDNKPPKKNTQPKVRSSNPSSPSHNPAPTKGAQKAHTRTLLP
jgi:hypothetical protein